MRGLFQNVAHINPLLFLGAEPKHVLAHVVTFNQNKNRFGFLKSRIRIGLGPFWEMFLLGKVFYKNQLTSDSIKKGGYFSSKDIEGRQLCCNLF